jgi:hypothetical protein
MSPAVSSVGLLFKHQSKLNAPTARRNLKHCSRLAATTTLPAAESNRCVVLQSGRQTELACLSSAMSVCSLTIRALSCCPSRTRLYVVDYGPWRIRDGSFAVLKGGRKNRKKERRDAFNLSRSQVHLLYRFCCRHHHLVPQFCLHNSTRHSQIPSNPCRVLPA